MREISAFDPNFKNEVAQRPGGERVSNCFLCGTCTAGCPISEVDADYNPRKIMNLILMGMKQEALSSDNLWKCQQCHVCVSHCPQDVRFADVLRVLREMAVEEGFAKPEMLEAIEKLDEELRLERIERIRQMTGRP